MTEQAAGPRCGNNPNVQLTDRDRKAIDDFKARLALQASAKPYIDSAVWVDGDPLMEVVAVTVWERCARDDENTPQLVCDDPRTIAAFAAAVARAHAAAPSAPAARAAIVAELLPVWEAVYEPGNVSDYLIGYANSEAAAKGAAEAWMRSQAEVTGRLEWVPEERLATGRYDQWFELIVRHDDGIDTGPGITVRRRVEPAAAPAHKESTS
jgi:hypothetical protein